MNGMSFEELEAALDASKDPKKRPKKESATAGDDNGDTLDAGDGGDALDNNGDGDDTLGDGNDGGDTLDAGAGELDDTRPLAKNYRFQTNDPKRQKFLTLMRRNPDTDIVILAKQAGYTLPEGEKGKSGEEAEAAARAAANVVDPLQSQKDALAAIEAEYAALNTQIEEAETNYLPTGKLASQLATKAVERHAAKEALKQAEVTHAEQVEYLAQYTEENNAAKEAAFKDCPDLTKKGTLPYRLMRAEMEEAEGENPRFLDDPQYPVLLLKRLRARYPTHFPASKAAVAGGKPVVQGNKPPAGKPVREMGSIPAGNRGGTDQPLDAAALEKRIDEMSLEELEALGNQVGTQGGAKRARR